MSIAEGTQDAEQVDSAAELPVVSPQRPGARGILAAIGMALLGFLGTAGAIHAAIRNPLRLHADMRSEKLAMLDQWSGKYFSASFGSSHVHNGFNPSAFDAVMEGSGTRSSTANLAIEGGSQSEQFAMAQEFVRHLKAPGAVGAPSQPCLVILELGAGANLLEVVHPRAINIYDWPTTRFISHLTSPEMSKKRRAGRVGFAATVMGLHYLNVGMLSNLIFAPPLNDKLIQEQTQDDRRGQKVLPYSEHNIARLHRLVDGLPRLPATSTGLMTPGNSELVERLAAESAVRHVSFVYVVMPIISNMASVESYPDHLTVAGPDGPMDVPIINLAQPAVYPQLYDPDIWFDEAHFDQKGSVLLSHTLGEELRKWYAAHGAPPPCG